MIKNIRSLLGTCTAIGLGMLIGLTLLGMGVVVWLMGTWQG